MGKPTSGKKRTISQAIFVGIFAVVAVVTWWKEEQKSGKNRETPPVTTTPTSRQALPTDLGHYDTVMARDKIGQNRIAPVDYFMLSLSWSPEFCTLQRRKNHGEVPSHLRFQCENQEQFGWVIHGLWPQNGNARSVADHPRFCQGDLPPVPEAIIKQYLPESPGASLLQGQWEKHGACAFADAEHYFAQQKALYRSLNLPAQDLPRKELFAWLKKYNPQLKNAYLKTSNNELYICYDKQFAVMDCPR